MLYHMAKKLHPDVIIQVVKMSLKLVEHMIHFMYTIFSKHVIAIQKVYPADFAVHAKLSYHADHADHADCADYTDQ